MSELGDNRLPARPTEQMLIDRLPEIFDAAANGPVVCTSLGRGQLAVAAARHDPGRSVVCHSFDLFAATNIREGLPVDVANLRLTCGADLPGEMAGVVMFPLSATGDAELTQELIQAAHQMLPDGGSLWTATDNADDSWLRARLAAIFANVTATPQPNGVVYRAVKEGPLKKAKRFECEFAFRDGGRLLKVVTRPGVFAHRRIDAGARQLINAMQISANARVLDLGCGSGCVALAAAAREAPAMVHAVDANTRAIQCVERSALLNRLANITAELTTLAAPVQHAGEYQVVLANPPYFGHFQIAERFLVAAQDALRPGGELLLVTKQPDWYAEHAPRWFRGVEIVASKEYWIVRGRKAAHPTSL